MKRTILQITFLIVLNFFSNSSFAQTSVPGGSVSGTWTKAASPYLIQGSIMIADGQTLSIESGVKVEFQGAYKLLVLGRLLAMGTLQDTITFTVADTTNGWRGIRFVNTLTTNDTSKIAYCKLQYGKATGASPDDNGGAFYFNNYSKAIISNCRITNCKAIGNGGGIYCKSSNILITHNTISYNSADWLGGEGYMVKAVV